MVVEGPGIPPQGGWLAIPFSPEIPAGTPLFNVFRVYSAVPPFAFNSEFRPTAIENFTENIEGDMTIDVIVSESVGESLAESWGGAFSLIVSLVSNIKIHRVWDRSFTEAGTRFSSYTYDSYYIKQIKPEKDSRNYRLVCVGMKEYLDKRLAIPAARNTIDGTVSVPDGSQEAKPIPASQILQFTNRTSKGIITGLLSETSLLQQLPIGWSTHGISGSSTRTYLMKDFLTIKEAINNLLDDEIGPPSIVFDGGYGSRANVSFAFVAGGFEKGYPVTTLSARSSEIFKPTIEEVESDVVNNLWTVGNASDGNILLAHKVQDGSTGKILLQVVDTQRNDIRTSSLLLTYSLGILQKSGQSIRTMSIAGGLTQKMLLAFTGNYFYIQAPEQPEIHETRWLIVARTIDMAEKNISYDCVEVLT